MPSPDGQRPAHRPARRLRPLLLKPPIVVAAVWDGDRWASWKAHLDYAGTELADRPRLSGRVLPAHPGLAMRIQMLTGRGWVTVATPKLSPGSLFSGTLLPRVRGRYLFRVVAPGTTLNTSGISRTISVRVT